MQTKPAGWQEMVRKQKPGFSEDNHSRQSRDLRSLPAVYAHEPLSSMAFRRTAVNTLK